MSANSFGQQFRITTFGESHGIALGVVIDGCPAGLIWDENLLRRNLDRRRPGSTQASTAGLVTARDESDHFELLSGVYEGRTLGTPLALLVRNRDARSQDYAAIQNSPRAGHADDVWKNKFGHSDPRGGGRSSGRETLCRVLGGSVAQMLNRQIAPELKVCTFTSQIGPVKLSTTQLQEIKSNLKSQTDVLQFIDSFPARLPNSELSQEAAALLSKAKDEGESFGGTVTAIIQGTPASLGQPVFHKLKSDLAQALMSIGATCGFEIGTGLQAASARGTEFHSSNPYGGIRGGISTGEEIELRLHFKPTSSILDVAKKGRHDPCIVIRAIPVVESMIHLVLADHLLWARMDRV